METTLNVLNAWSFVQFGCEHGNVSTQETENGSCLVFTDPATNVDTYVSISHKLPTIDESYLAANYSNLQVIETAPDAATLAKRQARAAQGLPTQMRSFVLCPKGESKRKALSFDFRAFMK